MSNTNLIFALGLFFLKLTTVLFNTCALKRLFFNLKDFILSLLELFKEVSVMHLLIPSNHLEVKCAQPRLNSCYYTIFLKNYHFAIQHSALKRLFLIWDLLYRRCLNCSGKFLLLPLSFFRIILRWKHVQHKLNSSSWTIFLKIDHCGIQHMCA